MKIKLPILTKIKPFKYLGTTKDYECATGRYIVGKDKIVVILNRLQENLATMEENTKIKEQENKQLLEQLYAYCKVLSDKVELLEEKLYAQRY
jgi:hypothetical protein